MQYCTVFTSRPVGMRSIVISVSVCMFVCLSIFPLTYLTNHTQNVIKIFYTCYLWPGSIILWRQGGKYFRFGG